MQTSGILHDSQNLESQITKPAKQPQHIKIGDIILLTLSINVFQNDIEANEARQRDEQRAMQDGGQGALLEETATFQTMNLQRITDTPEFKYKGVVYCEGINNLALQVLPKRTDENTKNALSQF